MNPQNTQYFNKLTHQTSEKSRELSKALTENHTEKLFEEVNHLEPMLCNISTKQDPQIASISKFKLPVIKSRLKTVQPKMKASDLSHSSRSRSIQSGEHLIQMYKEEKSDLIKKRQQLEKLLSGDLTRLKKMKIQKQIAACIRKQQDIKRELQYQQKLKQQRIEMQQLETSERCKKKEGILKRLEKMEKHKQQRQSLLSSKSVPAIPKYKIMQRVFLMQQIKHELDKKVAGKKLHESRYKDYLKEQHSSRRQSLIKDRTKKRVKTETDEKKQDKKQFIEKRKAMFQLLEEKRKHTFIKLDKDKAHLFEIAKDKTKNPQKYHFLKMKNLTEEQIYKEFQDFEMDFDPKNLGKQYLQESKLHLKKETSSSRIKPERIDSIQSISRFENNNNGKKEEQNSLNHSQIDKSQFSFQRGLISGRGAKLDSSKRHKEQIEKILRKSESKSKVLELLSQESSNNHKKMTQLEKLLTKQTEYQQFLKVEKNLDSQYLNFLKSKIIALGLQKL